MLARYNSRGDTIIEVLFAFTIFSLLAVGAVIIMNQGMAAAEKSLEITLVRQQIDAQTEALRYVRDAYFEGLSGKSTPDVTQAAADWAMMTKSDPVGKLVSGASPFGALPDGTCPAIPSNAFILDAHNGALSSQSPQGFDINSPAYSQVTYSPLSGKVDKAYGIWIEAVKSDPIKNYVDFHIRTCWNGPGSGPAATLGTIVRLYAPAA